MVPERSLVDGFSRDLNALLEPGVRVGIAVSGGPDSLALLLLAAAARPGAIEAATVDHGFRPESRDEAEMVAAVCRRLSVPHAILKARWADAPVAAIQEKAREERYELLGFWAEEQKLQAIATAHHADDQAETFLMRLARGAGVRGLSAMHRRSLAAGTQVPLIRPLLDWRRGELEEVCVAGGLEPARDPSNDDQRFERIRARRALAAADFLDPQAIARSAAHLGDADAALDWAVTCEWSRSVHVEEGVIVFRLGDHPHEIVRRIVVRAVLKLANEGAADLRGRELDGLVATLWTGGTATLRGVLCRGGIEWRFAQAPGRR